MSGRGSKRRTTAKARKTPESAKGHKTPAPVRGRKTPASPKPRKTPPRARSDASRRAADARKLRGALAEALEQQAATSEILQIIAQSPSDAQPVFDTIARAALELCRAGSATVVTFDGEWLNIAAIQNVNREGADAIRKQYPRRPGNDIATARAVQRCAMVAIPDVLEDPAYAQKSYALTARFRSILAIPLVRDRTPIGAITVARPKPGRFSRQEVALLRTFADQAVIAIENVRLFNETKEALDQQTATAEILQAISSSPGNLQPVFATLVRAAARFCGAPDVAIMRLEGEVLRAVAATGQIAEVLKREAGSIEAVELPFNRGSVSGRAVSDRCTVHIHDLAVESEKEYPVGREMQRRFGHHTTAATPLLREGKQLGVIVLFRTEIRPFSDKQLQLLRIFADQAVIAIENVRLFHELESRNHDLGEALEQQTATSEILRVISRSPTDVQPVFDTIVQAALSLCQAHSATVLSLDGEILRVEARALSDATPDEADAVRQMFPRPAGRETAAGRAVVTRKLVAIPDVLLDPEYTIGDAAIRGGFRSAVSVPLMRDGKPIGAINVGGRESGAFPDSQLKLLQTFADQAVIAIENARLFKELEARNRDLTEALEQQTATSEILSVINRSPTDVHPVFEAIADAALKLCRGSLANVFRFDGELLHLEVVKNIHDDPEYFDAIHSVFPRPLGRETAGGRAVVARDVIEIPDVLQDPEYGIRTQVLMGGFRSMVAVPLMLGDKALGSIAISRSEPERFPPSQIALLQTFADQAVIAIENVRLFKELEARNRDLTEALEQQTATGEVLKVISRSTFDLQPVLQTVIDNAVRVCGAEHGHIHRFDGEFLRLAAGHSANAEMLEHLRNNPNRLGPGTISGMAGLERRPIHWHDVLTIPDYQRGEAQRLSGFRTILAIPILSADALLGVIMIWKTRVEPFADKQIELVKAFADQAAIAIENVRLFKELEARNRDLTEALEQQTATSEILGVISKSQTDVQPVFDTIAGAALRLCNATSALVFTFDGELIHLAALATLNPDGIDAWRQAFPRPPSRESVAARAVLTRSVVSVPDVLEDPELKVGSIAIRTGFRGVLAVPLMREAKAIGAIGVGRAEAGLFSEKQIALLRTFADQAVIAIENLRLFNALEVRNRDLTEALEQQTATSEILSVISKSQTDVQPVFDTIAKAARGLCRATSANVFTYDGELVHAVAVSSPDPQYVDTVHQIYPRRPGRDTAVARAIQSCSVVMIPDVLADEDYVVALGANATAGGFRSVLAVPLMREHRAIGGIAVGRAEPGTFTATQVALLKTFADQAVIAVENMRLFKALEARNRDLTEALEHQTATSEILRVISNSPTDVQPVFEIIGERAEKLCEAELSVVTRVEGEKIHLAAAHGVNAETTETIRRYFASGVHAGAASSRAVRDRSVVQIPDVMADPEYDRKDIAVAGRWRGCLAVPMLREGQVIGTIFVAKSDPGRFGDSKVELLKTFADQAVIAIENVRLFKELEARNCDLTEALEQQTATSEILSVISRSQTDVQPVFDTIAQAAMELCRARGANVFTYDGEVVHLAAIVNVSPEYADVTRGLYPRPLDRDTAVNRAIGDREVVVIPDVFEDRDYVPALTRHATAGGFRSVLAVPLVREGQAVGGIAVGRAEPGPFPDAQVALLKTFADQAVIAIENVRLFNELKARTAELTRSVSELKALGEVGQAVSSTLDLETVLRTIVSRATELAGMDGGSIWEYDEQRREFHLHATDRLPKELVEVLRATPIRKGEGALGKLAVTSEPVSIRDFADDKTYKSRLRNALLRSGFHSVFAVPLLRENHLLGALAVNRKAPGEFDGALTELLKTFAGQSALAIQNARLFREIELKSRELETASRHKSEFLANMSHELRTPLNAIIGFSEVLAEKMFGEINEKQTEYLADILESARHLLSLINDILDLSKIEAGRMELESGEFDLPAAIENALILVRERAQRRAINLGRDVDERLGKIRGDERKVKQVLLNLLSNALKFTPEGGRIDVRAATRNGSAEISVSDTGVGIAPEDQAAVFEEFRQVGTAAKKIEGTGLGLAISRKFIELHGGRMWVESELGKGATFRFTLPQGS